ncbi:hypothetical protein B0H14DRAFT_2734726, partial [Mycena olivaceomarginata]
MSGSVSHFVGGASEVEVEPLLADSEPFIRLVFVLVLALVLILALALGSGVPLGTTPLAWAGNAASTGDARSTAPEPKPKLSTLRPAPTPATAVVGFPAPAATLVWRKLPHAPGGENAPLARLSGSLSPRSENSPTPRAPHGKCCGYGRGESALLEGPASPVTPPVSSGRGDLLLPSASTSADSDSAAGWRRSVDEAAELAALAGVIVASETRRESAAPARRAVGGNPFPRLACVAWAVAAAVGSDRTSASCAWRDRLSAAACKSGTDSACACPRPCPCSWATDV